MLLYLYVVSGELCSLKWRSPICARAVFDGAELNRRCDWRRRVVFAEMKVAEMCAPNSTDTVVDRAQKFRFSRKIFEKFWFFRQFHPKKIDFSGQIFEKFWFFQVISQKNSIFQGKFPKNFNFLGNFTKHFDFLEKFIKNFDFSGNFTKNFDFSKQIFDKFRFFKQFYYLFTATSGQIILFLFKSHHFRTHFLYMIRYNNILRPVHDPHNPPATPLWLPNDPPCPKSEGVATPQPPGLTPIWIYM